MIQRILVPKLGQTMEEAVIEKWHKKEGDTVEKGDVILEITTDKATLEVEAFSGGTIRKLLALEGITLPVNTVIALVGEPDDPLPDDLPALEAAARGKAAPATPPAPAQDVATTPAPPPAAPAPSPAPQPSPAVATPSGRILISPRARRLARKEKVPASVLRGTGPNGRIVEKDLLAYLEKRKSIRVTPAAKAIALERGVDVTLVKGTGPAGRVTRDDVLAAAPAARPTAPAPGRVELSAMRRVVAQRMSLSKREAPHFYLLLDIDMTEAVKVRKRVNDTGDVRVGFHDMIIRACATAMAEQPAMNVAWDNETILQRGEVNCVIYGSRY